MNLKQTSLVFFLFLVSGIFFLPSFHVEGQTGSAIVHPDVLEELEASSSAHVIVVLNSEAASLKGLNLRDEIRAEIARKDLRNQDLQNAVIRSLDSAEFVPKRKSLAGTSFSGIITPEGLDSLKQDNRVLAIYKPSDVRLQLTDSVPLIGAESYNLLPLNDGISGRNQTVCIVDSGIDTDHPDFGGKIVGQKCYCSEPNADGFPCCPDNTNESSSAEDDNGHGTHVAGIVAANSTSRGVAPDANIVAVKVCNETKGCDTSDVRDGIDWCRMNKDVYNISVISLSLAGGSIEDTSYWCDIDIMGVASNNAFNENILVVAASGNNGRTDGILMPACAQNVTSVGATYKKDYNAEIVYGPCTDPSSNSQEDDITCFTNRESILDILAPGAWIDSSNLGGGIDDKPGTSMATPHVSGVAALLLQAYPTLSPREIRDLMIGSGDPINDSTSTNIVFPRLNTRKSLGLEWPTENHDYRRSGFTILKGDMPDSNEIKTAQLVLEGDVTQEQVLRPSVADLDNNGRLDVITVVHNKLNVTQSTVYRFETAKYESQGSVWYDSQPRGSYTLQGGAVLSPPTLDDVDADGIKEVIVLLRNGTIAVLEPSGDDLTLKWSRSFPRKNTSTIGGSPSLEFNGGAAVVDLDLNGRKDIIFADAGLPSYLDWQSEVLVLDGTDGDTLWNYTYNGITLNESPGAYAPVSVENIDDDRFPEIIVPSYYGVYVFEFNSGQDRLDKVCNTDDGFLEGSAVVSDYDLDNEYEIIYTTSSFRCASGKTCENKTYVVNAKTCSEEDTVSLENISRVTPVIANLDSDSNQEVVISYGIGGTETYSDEGYIKCYDLSTENEDCIFNDNGDLRTAFVSPSVADIDKDDELEIIFAVNNGSRIWVLEGDGTAEYSYTFSGFIDSAIAIADIDGDNHAEIALKKSGSPITLLATMSGVNNPPFFTQKITNVTGLGGDFLNLNDSGTVTVSDAEGGPVSISYGSPFNQSGHWQSTVNDSGTYLIPIEASDGNLSDAQYVEVRLFNHTFGRLSNFIDGTYNQSFSFSGGENQSATVRLPKDILVQYAKLRLEGSQ